MQATSPVIIDFSAHAHLQDAQTANKKLKKSLKGIEEKVDVLVLRHTAVSGSAIMGPMEFTALEKLRVVDFSSTNASLTAIDNLTRFTHLEMAYFDNCPRVILTHPYPDAHRTLKVLSLLGTRVFPGAARHILETFPSLEQLSYTINKFDQKFLGVTPSEELDQVQELSVRIRKIEGVWKALPLDAENREIKEGQTLWLHNNKLYTTPQTNAPTITARLNPNIDINQDFELKKATIPYQILDRGLMRQEAFAIRSGNVSPK